MAISVLKTNKNTKKYLHLPLCFKICHVLFPLFFNPLPRPRLFFFKWHRCSGKVLRSQLLHLRIFYHNEPFRNRARCSDHRICPRKPASVSDSWPWNWTWGSDSIKTTLNFYDSESLGYTINFHQSPHVCLLQDFRLFPKSIRPATSECLPLRHRR